MGRDLNGNHWRIMTLHQINNKKPNNSRMTQTFIMFMFMIRPIFINNLVETELNHFKMKFVFFFVFFFEFFLMLSFFSHCFFCKLYTFSLFRCVWIIYVLTLLSLFSVPPFCPIWIIFIANIASMTLPFFIRAFIYSLSFWWIFN